MKNKTNASLSLRKLLLSALVAAPMATLPVPLWALPATQTDLNSQVVSATSGTTITLTSATRVDVRTSATNSVIKWLNFGATGMQIGANDVVAYAQPSTTSAVLNSVTGTAPTVIDGTLSSNGRIFIMNPYGVQVSGTGSIQASAVGLSTIAENEFNFQNTGNLAFVQNQTPSPTPGTPNIVVAGQIKAASGSGNVWLASAGTTDLSGGIDGGAVWVKSTGATALGVSGTLTIGDSAANASTLTVSSGGAITIGNAGSNKVTVYGSSVSLDAGNNTIQLDAANTGGLQIGTGSGNVTLTTKSGTADTKLDVTGANVILNSSGALTVNSSGNNVDVKVTPVTGTAKVVAQGSSQNDYKINAGGDLTLDTLTVKHDLIATATGNVTSNGNSAVTNNETITAGSGANVTLAGNVTNSLSISASSGTLKNVTINSTKDVALTAITAGNLTVSATGNITQTGAQTITNTASLTATGNAVLSQAIGATDLVVTTNSGGSLNHDITVSAAQTVSGNATFNSAGKLVLQSNVTAGVDLNGTASGDISTGSSNNLTATAGSISLTSTGGGITFGGTVTAGKNVTLTAAKSISQGAASNANTITTGSSNTLTLDAGDTVDLGKIADASANDIGNLVVKNAPNGATVNTKGGFTLAKGTNATGNVTLNGSRNTSGTITIGGASGDNISVAGDLVIDNTKTTNSSVAEMSNNVTVAGNISVAVGGTGTISLRPTSGASTTNNSYGQVQLTTAGGAAAVFSNGTLNLGAISTGTGNVTAYSRTSIVNTDQINVAGTIWVGAGTAAAPGSIALDYTTKNKNNTITGTVMLLDDLHLLDPSSTIIGNYLASSLTIDNSSSTTGSAPLLVIGPNVYGNGTSADIKVTQVGAGTLGIGQLVTTGGVWLTSDTGAITANDSGNSFSNLTVTTKSTATSQFSSSIDLTANLTVPTSDATGDNTFTSSKNLTIGAVTSLGKGRTTFTATAGKGAITDAGPGIFIYGNVTMNAGSINVTKSGHNFGQLTLDTTVNNGAISLQEGGTLNIANVNAGKGAVSLTSANGDIIENGGTGVITSTGAVTLSAQNGAIVGNATNALGDSTAKTAGNLSLSAKNNSSFKNNYDVALATTSVAAGNLTITLTGTDNNLTQKAGSTINTFGASSFTATGAGNVTLNQSGNQFGALSVSTGTGDVNVKESTTLNVASVTGTGNVTLTSENGDIVETGAGSNGLTISGNAAFSAPNGSISLTNTKNDFVKDVALTAGGNVAIVDKNDVSLNTTTIGGTLDVTAGSSSTLGNITQNLSSVLTVAGDTTLLAPNANSMIGLANTGNQFGGVRFTVGSKGATIDEATTFNLRAGSFATGPVTINTGGDFVTSGTGGSSFTGASPSLTIWAPSGTIKPGQGSLLVVNKLVVFSNVAIDLSGLSLSGNLANVAPDHSGTGTYVAPSP